jgi:chromosome partitioning protein
LIIPFSADGSSKRAVGTVLSLLYGITRTGGEQSEFFRESQKWKLVVPKIYCYVGNRMTQANFASAAAFHAVVTEIGSAIWSAWRHNPNNFVVHPPGKPAPATKATFAEMFQFEIVDANTASVVSSSLGIPLVELSPGMVRLTADKQVRVNISQLKRQQPNIKKLVQTIE